MADSIFIASPYSRAFEGACTASIAGTIADLTANGIGTEFYGMSAAIIGELRDALCHRFLVSAHSHMLFIDSDTAAPARLARTMHGFNLPFVGTIYAQRSIDLAKVIAAAKAGKPNPEAHGYKFNYKSLTGDRSVAFASNGLCKVKGVGFGFVLLRRDCLEKMAPNAPVYKSSIAGATVKGFFQTVQVGDKILHEDYSFCHRWREAGGEVIAYTHADIKHIGTFDYGVPFSVAAKAGAL